LGATDRKMTSQLLRSVSTAVLVATMVVPTGCLLFPRSHDYAFSVTGVVLDEVGLGLPQVEVTLEVQGPVFEVIEPVRTRTVVTGDSGAFHFMYISHQRAVPYSLTFSKEGYKPQHLTGAAPPDAPHELVMNPIQAGDRE